MDDDPAASVRTEEGLLARARRRARCATARPARWCRPATPARRWRRRCCAWDACRASCAPCIATPIPNPGRTPMVLVDAGANAECTPEMLVQFALMASTFVTAHYRRRPIRASGCCRSARSRRRARRWSRRPTSCCADASRAQLRRQRRGPRPRRPRRSTSSSPTASPATSRLKTLEGALRFIFATVLVGGRHERRRPGRPATCSFEYLLPLAAELTPETQGGAMLLGVDGICVISPRVLERDRDQERPARGRRAGRSRMSSTNCAVAIRPDQGLVFGSTVTRWSR